MTKKERKNFPLKKKKKLRLKLPEAHMTYIEISIRLGIKRRN